MIVTLTLNPCIDLNLEIEDFAYDTPLRAVGERKRAGGKGVNVNQCLNGLGIESIAVVPLGGPGGMEFKELAEAQLQGGKTKLIAAAIKGNTRTNVVISSARDSRQIKVNEQGPELSKEDAMSVYAAIDGYVGYGDVIALCGSLPRGVEAEVYRELIVRYRSRGAFVALDADGEALKLGIEAKPDVVKPNREELGRWACVDLTEDAAFADAARAMAAKTGGLCLATDGARSALLACGDSLLRVEPAPANGSPVGAGDAALAGLLSVLASAGDPHRAARAPEVLAAAFRMAAACGSASASTPDTVPFSPEIVAAFLEKTPVPVATFLQQ